MAQNQVAPSVNQVAPPNLPWLNVQLLPEGKVRLQGNVTNTILGCGMLEDAKHALREWVHAKQAQNAQGGGIQAASVSDLEAIDKLGNK